MNLNGKYILVTGGARRIGAAISRKLASLGANVIVHYNSSMAEAEQLVAELCASGTDSFAVQSNFANPEFDAVAFFSKIHERTGGQLFGLVNNASLYAPTGSHAAALCHAIHVTVPEALIRKLAALSDKQGASVVNILDTRVCSSDPKHVEYLEAKRELTDLTRSLALELAPSIRINAVAPGIVLEEAGTDPAELQRLSGFNPLKTHGTPEGVAECVSFLLSSDFITGHIIKYDGGYSLAH